MDNPASGQNGLTGLIQPPDVPGQEMTRTEARARAFGQAEQARLGNLRAKGPGHKIIRTFSGILAAGISGTCDFGDEPDWWIVRLSPASAGATLATVYISISSPFPASMATPREDDYVIGVVGTGGIPAPLILPGQGQNQLYLFPSGAGITYSVTALIGWDPFIG